MGEETSVDTACAKVDRAARRLLDGDRVTQLSGMERALTVDESHAGRWIHQESTGLNALYRWNGLRPVRYGRKPGIAGTG